MHIYDKDQVWSHTGRYLKNIIFSLFCNKTNYFLASGPAGPFAIDLF